MSVNYVHLLGRLVRDPECRYGEKTASCRMTVAVDRPKIQKDQKAESDFISCVAFGKTAETIGNYFSKGQRIFIHGALRTSSYTNKQGQKINTTDVFVNSFEFIDSKKNTNSNARSSFDSMGGTIGDEIDF